MCLMTKNLSCSFSLLCSSGDNNCIHNSIPLYSKIWPDAYIVLYISLLPSWFFVGMCLAVCPLIHSTLFAYITSLQNAYLSGMVSVRL